MGRPKGEVRLSQEECVNLWILEEVRGGGRTQVSAGEALVVGTVSSLFMYWVSQGDGEVGQLAGQGTVGAGLGLRRTDGHRHR